MSLRALSAAARRAAASRMAHSLLCGALIAAAMVGATGCPESSTAPNPRGSDTIPVPISQLVHLTYRGFSGGLYPDSDEPPPAHAAAGVTRAKAIAPVDAAGHPDPNGAFVLLSIGITNAAREFCSNNGNPPCTTASFTGQAAADSAVNHTTLAIVNGAAPDQEARLWESPSDSNYDRIRDTWLAPASLSEAQVQIVWLKVVNAKPTQSLPAPDADALVLERRMGNIVRALHARYPTLRMVFLTSRIYGGYATLDLNPEPYAYETGFAVKWLVQAQIDQMAAGSVKDTLAGDLDYDTTAPWIAWGPYLWADGETGRSDGLQWFYSDFQIDGTYPSQAGVRKVGEALLRFFKESGFSRCWFAPGNPCL